MLKLLNILGYISLLSLLFFIPIFILSFDLFLQMVNIVLFLILIMINFIFFRKKKHLGIRCLVIIITLFILSSAIYNRYGIIKGKMFKNKINEICDQNRNVILTSKEITNYNIKYVPDKFVIDDISKGGGAKGYIKFENSNKYEEISYSAINSPKQYAIICNSDRYYLNKTN